MQGFPDHIEGPLSFDKHVAKIAHIILLAGILIMPISGYLMSETNGYTVSFFGLFNLPEIADSKTLAGVSHNIHGVFSKILIGITALHIAGALKHHFINKDVTLMRMIGKD